MVVSSAHFRGRTPAPVPGEREPVSRPTQADLLRRHGIRLDKRLGQHFLVDRRVPDRIADAVAALRPERVIELASGAGALSFALLERGWPVHALELDPRMIDLMREETSAAHFGGRFRVERADLARTDFAALVGPERVVFAGNLPYQVTSPVLFALLPALRSTEVAGAVLMVQNEVAQRMAAAPGGRTYGVLSVMLQAELEVRRLFTVKPGAFLPPPEVDSAVVELRHREEPVVFLPRTRALVRVLFQQRRKQMGGLVKRLLDLDEDQVGGLFARLELDPRGRPERLAPEDFARLGAALDAAHPRWERALVDLPIDDEAAVDGEPR